jgi:hypothetical protein
MRLNRARVTLEMSGTEQEFIEALKAAMIDINRSHGLRCKDITPLPAAEANDDKGTRK